MVIFRAIGAFFSKIWHWIKETAWVQPLLIVGIIFGVIFAIPSIVKGISGLVSSFSESYFLNHQLSLENGATSAADKLTQNILAKTNDSTVKSEYGEKFFLVYAYTDCSQCKDVAPGFETLEDNFNSTLKPKDTTYPYKLYTIFSDEITDDTTTYKTAFAQYLDRNPYFFELASGVGYNSQYYLNNKITSSDLDALQSSDVSSFKFPTILLIDYTTQGTQNEYGISEVMFGVSGDNDFKKAQLLLDCWDHKGDFSDAND